MNYAEYPELDDYQQRLNLVASHTQSVVSILLGSAVVAYAVFKTLEILGYPVWLWLHQLAQMLSGALGLHGAQSSEATHRAGGMLGSLLGMSPGNLLQKSVRGMVGALSRGPSAIPPGLGNVSNSCYQNSIIQGLASLPSLRDYLHNTTSEHATLTADSMNGALQDMIAKLNDPNNVGQHFWIRGKLKSMSVFQQQDAQEYYSKILDAMDEEVKKASSSKRRTSVSWVEATKNLADPTVTESKTQARRTKEETEKTRSLTLSEQPKILPNPLDGLLAQRVGCTSCGYSEGLSLIPFNCVTVSLGRNARYEIRECLNEYTALEYIEGVECAKCTLLKLKSTLTPLATDKPDSPFSIKLNAVQEALENEDFEDKTLIKTLNVAKKNWVQSTKSKQVVVARAPKSLVLHVNRSGFNENTGMPYKNNAGVSYPMVLDLGNWCLGNTPSGSQHPDISLEEWPRDPRASMLPSSREPTPSSPFQYRLRAAVTHYGSHGNGHYVCYRPHPKATPREECSDDVEDKNDEKDDCQEEQWWRFSDDTVYAVSESEAYQGNVFMLFYERVDMPVQALSEVESAVTETVDVPADVLLPPVDSGVVAITTDEAANIPLPEDNDCELFVPQSRPFICQTPSHSQHKILRHQYQCKRQHKS